MMVCSADDTQLLPLITVLLLLLLLLVTCTTVGSSIVDSY
jgi:hypothetical protein